VAEQRVVVEVDLRVERDHLALLGDVTSGLISAIEQSSSHEGLREPPA
jgi:hypothetical protein